MIRLRDARAVLEVGSEHVDGAGLPTPWHGVNEDRRGRVVEQRECKVESADAVVGDADVLRIAPGGELPDDLDTESVVAEEDVSDSGHEDRRIAHGCTSEGSSRSRSSSAKKKRCPG